MRDNPVFEVKELNNKDYSLLIYTYAFNQYRIKLTDKRKEDLYAPIGHGAIVREL